METQVTQLTDQESVQPTEDKKVSNVYIWILAIIPLVGMLFAFGSWVVLAINVILCGLDEAHIKKQGYDTKGLGGIFLFLIPVYLYKRAKLLGHKPTYLVVWCLLFALSFFTVGTGDASINAVKNGTLDGYPQTTLGESLGNFLSNAKWESLKAEDGNTYVNVTGGITFDGRPADLALQYRVYDTGRFEYQALEINGVPQSTLVYWGLIEKIYE